MRSLLLVVSVVTVLLLGLVPTSVLGQAEQSQRCVTFQGDVPVSAGEIVAAILRGELAISEVGDPASCGSADDSPTTSLDAIYEASSGADFEEWELGGSWDIAGDLLVSSGGRFYMQTWELETAAIAPAQLQQQNYAVEVEMEVLDSPDDNSLCLVCSGDSVGMLARVHSEGGYAAGFGGEDKPSARVWALQTVWPGSETLIAEKRVKLAPGYHVVRLELRDNTFRMLVDEKEVLKGTDNHSVDPGQVGMWSNGVQVAVRRFTVYPLD